MTSPTYFLLLPCNQQSALVEPIVWATNRCLLLVGIVTFCLPVLAQNLVSTLPVKNANNVLTTTAVQVTASQSFSAGQSLAVFSAQAGGRKGGNTGIVGPSLTYSPTEAFKPGEVVYVSVPTQPHSVFQFTTAVKAGGGQFAGKTEVSVGLAPRSVTTGDVDGDGDLDLLTANNNEHTVSVRLNDGSGHFTGSTQISVGIRPESVTTGDVDGDGDLDLLTANGNDNSVSVLLNNGIGSFSATTPLSVGSRPESVTARDVDGDGDLDILTANIGDNSVSVLFNDGNGNFSTTTQVSVGFYPYNVTMGDVDGDGDLDMLTANSGAYSVSVRLNDGAGHFSGATEVVVKEAPFCVVTADVDSDGDLDILAANYQANSVSVRLNDGSGHFTGVTEVSVQQNPTNLVMGDVDGDGDLDMLVTNLNSNSVSIRLNDGTGYFTGATELMVVRSPYSLITADIDGDGDLDILAAGQDDNSVSIWLNQAPLPISLKSFTAQAQGDWVQLFWKTEWETKFAGFQLERSTDAGEFSPIGWLAAQANAQAGATYRYNDLTLPPAESTLYYRLKMVDLDGSFSYSTIRSVSLKAPRLSLLALGNPVRGNLRLLVSSPQAQAVRLQLVSSSGQVIREQTLSVVEGRSQPELSVAGLGAGQYQIMVSDETTQCVQRIIIE